LATTIAIEDPNHTRFAAKMLGHQNVRTTEMSYIAATSESALGRHRDFIASMRKTARQRRRNSAQDV
jgi:hypothetical protein